MFSYSASANQSLEVVWKHLLDKIEHPENFVPGVSEVQILERQQEEVTRAMNLTTPDGTVTRVVEKITYTPYRVRFAILEHPLYEGYVDNVAEQISENETRITFLMDWKNKNTGEPFINQVLMQNAVHKTIDYIQQAK